MAVYYEDLTAGQVIEHRVRRTVTETDNVLITALTMNPQPLHLDAQYAADTPFGARIVNSLYTLGLTVSLSVVDISLGTTLGNLGYESVRFPVPVLVGDTIGASTRVVSLRLSGSNPQAGVVCFEHVGRNQHDEVVCVCQRFALMKRHLTAAEATAPACAPGEVGTGESSAVQR